MLVKILTLNVLQLWKEISETVCIKTCFRSLFRVTDRICSFSDESLCVILYCNTSKDQVLQNAQPFFCWVRLPVSFNSSPVAFIVWLQSGHYLKKNEKKNELLLQIPASLLRRLSETNDLSDFLQFVDNVTFIPASGGRDPYVAGSWETVDGNLF